MLPSEYIATHGKERNITGLQNVLLAYQAENADDIEQMKAITPRSKMSEQTMQSINAYEVQVQIANEAIQNWKEETKSITNK